MEAIIEVCIPTFSRKDEIPTLVRKSKADLEKNRSQPPARLFYSILKIQSVNIAIDRVINSDIIEIRGLVFH